MDFSLLALKRKCNSGRTGRITYRLTNIKCHVNLIPVNYVLERIYVQTPREQIFEFEKT
jgi:adenine C2-methylase RlmN of 23S rRNA A2503 and tRNA A37